MGWTGSFESVTCYAYSHVMKDQKHKCSYNFQLNKLNTDKNLYWYFPEEIIFDVMQDVAGAIDPVLYKGMKSGNCWGKTEYAYSLWGPIGPDINLGPDLRDCYFANVRRIDGKQFKEEFSFEITITTKRKKKEV